MKNYKNKNGISLVALVITIIVLLILSGISLSFLLGENGFIQKVQQAKNIALTSQQKENITLTNYDNLIQEYFNGTNTTETITLPNSTLISEVSLESIVSTENGFTATINSVCEDPTKILDYHIYMINTNTSEILSFVQTTKEIKIATLQPDIPYQVYVLACDTEAKFKKSTFYTITPTTIPLKINSVYIDLMSNTNISDVTAVSNVLFDGNTNNSGTYQGVLIDSAYSHFIDITVTKPIKLYGYGHYYSDGGGNSGQNLIVEKYNGSAYENYQICPTDTSGNRYELVTLQPGNYRFTAQSRYVTFNEWELVPIL